MITSTTAAKIQEIKSKGVLQARENNVELYLVIGKWNKLAKKADTHWFMVSEKTGVHEVITQNNRMDERVRSHWEGFKKLQE